MISNIASWIYLKLQKYSKEKQKLARFVKRKSKGWLRLSHKVADGAIEYAREKKADNVICGHTHQILNKSKNGTNYYNTGCWTDIPSNFIIITHDKRIITQEYKSLKKSETFHTEAV